MILEIGRWILGYFRFTIFVILYPIYTTFETNGRNHIQAHRRDPIRI